MEILTAAFSASNLIITLLFLAVLIYWSIVIVGAIKIDSIDFNVDADHHIHIDHGQSDIPHDVPNNSWFFGMLRFFNFGRVPFMVVISILIISMWTISMMCNHEGSWLNPYNYFLLSLLYVVPNIIVSAFVMKFLSTPLIPVFDKLDTSAGVLHYEGYNGTITTELKKDGLGQAKLFIDNSTILVSVKTKDGSELKKGDKIVILEQANSDKCYIVEKTEDAIL
jgi:hypothetical protein